MADKIQHLIDQIQKEGVDTAIQKAEEIIADANQQAEQLIANAEKECAEKRAAAEVDAAALTERSIKTIKQAGRDLLILLGQSCEKRALCAVLVKNTLEKKNGPPSKEQIIQHCMGGGGVRRIPIVETEVKFVAGLTTFISLLLANR